MPATTDGPITSGPLSADQATSVVLRLAAIPTIAVGVLTVVLGAIFRGGVGALGAALGAVIAVAFFVGGQYILGRILSGNPGIALSGALLLYLTQILVLFGLIALLKDATWLDPKMFAIAIMACTLVWVVASIWANMRTKVLYVEPGSGPESDS